MSCICVWVKESETEKRGMKKDERIRKYSTEVYQYSLFTGILSGSFIHTLLVNTHGDLFLFCFAWGYTQ